MERIKQIGKGIGGFAIVGVIAAAIGMAGASQASGGQRPENGHSVGWVAAHGGAHAAGTLNGTDTAHLHLVHQHEMLLYEEGTATGKLPGRMRAELTVGSVFTGRCTIYTAGGSVTGRGHATPHGSGRYQSFSGALLVTGGTGRYAHIRGRTGLYGTFDRRTFSLVIQTTGDLSY